MDIEENAGDIFDEYANSVYLNIVTPEHPCARDIRPPWMVEVAFVQEHTNAPFILNIVTPAHPCARDIPFILNIKKAVKNDSL